MPTPAIVLTVIAVRRSHPAAPALDLLDLVMRGHPVPDITTDAEWAAPGSPFGAVLAEAFDQGMTPQEWAAWSGPSADPVLAAAVLSLWPTAVLQPFIARHRTP